MLRASVHALPPVNSQAEASESTAVVLNVGITCQGCVGAVTRLLQKVEGEWRVAEFGHCMRHAQRSSSTGVESVDADVEQRKVTVNGTASEEACIAALSTWASKSGKVLQPWSAKSA